MAGAGTRRSTASCSVLPNGGMIIDTPGLRSIGVYDADDGLAQVFAEIEELADAVPLRRLRTRNRT